MGSPIRIVIADDHLVVRRGLSDVINVDPGLTVIAEAGDGWSALEQIEALRPDVAVLDIDMPEMDGFGVVRALRSRQLACAVIFLTIHREEDLFNEGVELGVQGYVLKDSSATDIVTAIIAVAAGQHYSSPALTSYLFERRRRGADLRRETPTLQDLTPTERRILLGIVDYKTSREIADELFVSHRTVETHRTNICTKLQIRGRHALMKFALKHRAEL